MGNSIYKHITIIVIALLFVSCRTVSIDDSKYWQLLQPNQEVCHYQNIEDVVFSLLTGPGSVRAWGHKPISTSPSFYVCVDKDWFQTIEKKYDLNSTYAKDDKHVYFQEALICIDCDDNIGENPCFSEFMIDVLKDVDPNKFKYLGNGYAISGRKMFKNGKRIKYEKAIIDSLILLKK